MDDPILLSVYSPVRDSKRSLSAEPLYQTRFTTGPTAGPTAPADCVCLLASQCPAELVVTESNSPVKDYSSLINPRNKVTLLTSEKAAKQTESKPVRFLERKRRTTVEDTGTVHIHHHYQDIGAKVRNILSLSLSLSYSLLLCRLTVSVWPAMFAAASLPLTSRMGSRLNSPLALSSRMGSPVGSLLTR